MKIYWLLKSIPELAEMPKKERKAIWRRCCWKVFRHWQTWLALIVCGACARLGVILGQMWVGNYIVGAAVGGAVGAAVGGGIGGFVFAQVAIAMGRRHIREYLNLHNEAPHACPHDSTSVDETVFQANWSQCLLVGGRAYQCTQAW